MILGNRGFESFHDGKDLQNKSYNLLMATTLKEAPRKSAPNWVKVVEPYKQARALRGISEWLQAVGLLGFTWFMMYQALSVPYGLLWCLLLAPVAGALLVKTFAVQHDCGHGALFNQAWANDWAGRALSFIVLTPYRQWAREHAKHHATSGNLSFRGIGDVDVWTVKEYQAATPWSKFWYRVYRNPFFLLGPGATGYFFFKQRWVWYAPERWESWVSVWSTNAAIVAFLGLMSWWWGFANFMVIWVPSFIFASALGTWVFYVGHQYEDAYWEKEEKWDFFEASMKGASFYRPGALLDYATCNIGYHHIHHLCSRVPFYNLPQAHADNEMFHVKELGLIESFKCATLALWDEERKKMVRFRDLKTIPA
jgi:omega-6 fatty acid desaturase (delta-12 desaturase)